jgi:hypothetical protein
MDIYNIILISVFVILIISIIWELSCDDCYARRDGKYLKSVHSGLVRGFLIGCLTGDFWMIEGIEKGVLYATTNSLILNIGY